MKNALERPGELLCDQRDVGLVNRYCVVACNRLRMTPAGRFVLAQTALRAGSGGGPTEECSSWKPPAGYVGTKTIMLDKRFRKNNKNPVESTIQRWVERSRRQGTPVDITRDPATHENYYPETWILEQLPLWNPRKA